MDEQTNEPPRWVGWRLLELIYDMNQRCLESVSRMAACEEGQRVELLRRHHRWWASLDAAARERAARVPFALLDVHFDDGDWWEKTREMVRARSGEGEGIPRGICEQLVIETLNNVWHAVRTDIRVACMAIGVSRTVAEVIAKLEPADIRQVAAVHTAEQVLRWSHRPKLWKRFLVAAVTGNGEVLAAVQLHVHLLLCGELITAAKQTYRADIRA